MSTDRLLRVMFVDDEFRLLDGLRRAMRGFRSQWDMSFALSGTEALSHLAVEPADIVMSDMRMPGMDGAALLAEVARLHPQTIRVILSGQSDAIAARRAIHVAHQFLAKPIATPVLAELIVRLGDIRGRLEDVALRRRASGTSVLPAVPALYDEVMRLCAGGSASVLQLGDVIERDPAMTAKLLHLAGSSFFGRPLRATGVANAVSYLGLDTLRAIARDGELATTECDDPPGALEVATDQLHSLLVARIARRIVPDRLLADDAFAAGLLHDIGKRFVSGGTGDAATIHADVGAYLLGIWGLPVEIVDAVGGHHLASGAAGDTPLAAVTRVANALAHERMDEGGWTTEPMLSTTALDAIGMRDSLSTCRAIAAEESAVLGSAQS